MRTLTAIFFYLLVLSCGQSQNNPSEPANDLGLIQKVDSVKFANFVDTISYELLCKSIDTVNKMFSAVKDSTFESEGVEWPGKIVTHPDGSWTVFETSWTDKQNIWRVTTTSKSIKFQTPYQVGDSIAKVRKDGYAFTFNEGDGGEYYYFTNERLKHLGFRVEDKYSNEFYKNVYEKGLEDPMKNLSNKATIIELTISGGCTERDLLE
jgi:hypothetical protein